MDKPTRILRDMKKPNHQLCFVTQNAIDSCLKFVERKEIKNG